MIADKRLERGILPPAAPGAGGAGLRPAGAAPAKSVRAILLDVDGVLHVSGEAIPGAPEAVHRLRRNGHRLRLVTNNTTRSRSQLASELRALGFDVDEEEIETTPLAAARLLAGKRVVPLTMAAIRPDLEKHVELVERDADVVLVGGADESDETGRVFSYENLNRAFAELRGGARLVALH
jgi:ribonucleotide monophosphatase NagD (HAD superfamily)